MNRKRIRDYGITIGSLPPGKRNTITDIPGVTVGHCTIDTPRHKTGVTVILPSPENIFQNKLPASAYVLNGFGKTAGLLQVQELGTLESPIALTNTLNVGLVQDALVEYMVNRCYTMYMQQNNNVMFNLLDSHDTERLMNRFHDLDMFYQQLAVLFTMPGSACIYYGTEIAMEGGHDPDCRRPMPWHELSSPENQEKIAAMRSLIELRKTEEACRSLYFHFPGEYREERLVEYIKLDSQNRKLEVLLNCGEEAVSVKEEGEVLFSRKYQNGVLEKNGTLVRRKLED